MIPGKKVSIVAGIALALASGAFAAEPTQQELAEQVKQLQAKVNALENRDQAAQANVDAVRAALIRDADKHSKMMQLGGMAGYDDAKGFMIQSANGDFTLHPWVQFMPRFVATYLENGKHAGDDDSTETGFEIRRLKLGFDGNLWGKEVQYLFLWATDRKDGGLKLEEGFGKFYLADNWWARVGQFKDPLAHEGLTSSKKLLAAERTYLQDVVGFGDNFVQGASLIWGDHKDSPVFFELAFTDGTQSANTNFQDQADGKYGIGSAINFGVAARVEYKLFGDWKSYEDFTAMGNTKDLLVIGGGVNWDQLGDSDVFLHTVDAQWEMGKLGLYAAYLGRYIKKGPNGDSYSPGALIQAAFLLDQKWEVFGRYDYIHFDGKEAVGNENTVHEFTVGLNYYMHGHNAKFTFDASYLPNGAPIGDDGSGVLKNDGNNIFMLRGQLQLVL